MFQSNYFIIFILLFCYCEFAINIAAAEDASAQYNLTNDLTEEPPTVLIALLVRNKAHTLPYFLTYLERLNYPKDRVALWIRSDHNEDSSIELLQLWLNRTEKLYHDVNFSFDNATKSHQNESSPYDWPLARFQHLIKLKEDALTYAQKIWADYVFYLDADVFLTSSESLKHLTSLRLPIVAPMLLSEGLYSNYWCGMTDQYYYRRTEEYKEIYNVHKQGNFQVPMVHSAVLVNLNYMESRYLNFDIERLKEQQLSDVEWAAAGGHQCRLYDGPIDDIIIFAISANCSQIPMYISNDIPYGYILQPLEVSDDLSQDLQQLINIKANMINDLSEAPDVHETFEKYVKYPERQKLTLDHIYMINLERRPERRKKMDLLFNELGLDVEHFPAIDGKYLNSSVLKEMGITFLEGYEDPFHHREMTMGEIGCFLSHYRIWEKMIKRGQNEVLILEDDIRFEPYFAQRAIRLLEEARYAVDYDLIYFGRKRLKDESEPWVEGTENLVHVGYSYWTLGYVISMKGARKLLAAKPLEKILPVDEFLPVMFNRHPNKTWSDAFPERNLIAFSAAPLLLFPIHYTGEMGYISDTEDSELTTSKLHDSNADAQLKSDREYDFIIPENSGNFNRKKDSKLNEFLYADDAEKILKREFDAVKHHNEL